MIFNLLCLEFDEISLAPNSNFIELLEFKSKAKLLIF